MLDQTHLEFLAEISSRNLGIKINEPTVTEPSVTEPPELEPEPEPKPEQIFKRKLIFPDYFFKLINNFFLITAKLPEKSQSKRKSSHEHSTSKRRKSTASTNR